MSFRVIKLSCPSHCRILPHSLPKEAAARSSAQSRDLKKSGARPSSREATTRLLDAIADTKDQVCLARRVVAP